MGEWGARGRCVRVSVCVECSEWMGRLMHALPVDLSSVRAKVLRVIDSAHGHGHGPCVTMAAVSQSEMPLPIPRRAGPLHRRPSPPLPAARQSHGVNQHANPAQSPCTWQCECTVGRVVVRVLRPSSARSAAARRVLVALLRPPLPRGCRERSKSARSSGRTAIR